MTRPSRRQVLVEGRPVRYRVLGSGGEDIVLVHGLSGSWRWWRRVAPRLAERHSVHLLDLPGFGSVRSRGFRLAGASEWLGSWLEAADLERSYLVGHSLGGLVCARLAAVAPERVDGLVLVAPAGVPSGRSLLADVVPLVSTLGRMQPHLLGTVVADALRAGPATILRSALELARADVRADLRRIAVRTLLVWGEADALVGAALAESWRRELADVRLAMLPRGGHVPMFDQPEAFTRVVLDFLAESPQAASAKKGTTTRASSSGAA